MCKGNRVQFVPVPLNRASFPANIVTRTENDKAMASWGCCCKDLIMCIAGCKDLEDMCQGDSLWCKVVQLSANV